MASKSKQIANYSSSIVARNGEEFSTSSDVWKISDGINIYNFDFNLMLKCVTENMYFQLRRTILLLLQDLAVSTVSLRFSSFKNFINVIFTKRGMFDRILCTDIVFFNSLCESYSIKSSAFSIIIALYDFECSCVDEDVFNMIKKVYPHRNYLGSIVTTFNPHKGPYTPIEKIALYEYVDHLYANNFIKTEVYVVSLLVHLLALRPRQIALLKINDYEIQYDKDNMKRYVLNVPRVKQGLAIERSMFTQRQINYDFALIIEDWIDSVKREYCSNNYDDYSNVEQIPLIPDWTNNTLQYTFHRSSGSISTIYRNINLNCGRNSLISHRTGEKMNINTTRSRHTLGTNMALAGCNVNQIAYALDHSSLISSKYYIQNGQAMAEVINNGVAQYHEPVVKSFKGEVFARSNIKGTRHTYNPVRSHSGNRIAGLCVNPSGCGVFMPDSVDPQTFLARVPFSCYQCWSFNAFDDIAVHKEHFELLLLEKQQHINKFQDDNNASQPLIVMHYDSMIQAVSDVILKILAGEISIFDVDDEVIDSF